MQVIFYLFFCEKIDVMCIKRHKERNKKFIKIYKGKTGVKCKKTWFKN